MLSIHLFPVNQAIESIFSPKNICYHFVADEHWNYFDGFYSAVYDVDRCWKQILGCLDMFPEALFDELEEGMIAPSETAAFQDYCCPGIGGWLRDMKKMYS